MPWLHSPAVLRHLPGKLEESETIQCSPSGYDLPDCQTVSCATCWQMGFVWFDANCLMFTPSKCLRAFS